MKQVKLTNASVTSFWKPKDSNDPDVFVKVIPPKEGSDFKSSIVSFQVETKVSDNPARRARIFQKCTVFADSQSKINEVQNLVKPGAVLEIEGYEDRRPSGKDDGKYYSSIVCNKITPITNTMDQQQEQHAAEVDDDNLPF